MKVEKVKNEKILRTIEVAYMIVGNREESIVEKTERHRTEVQEQINGLKNELKYAKEHNDVRYQKWCIWMLKIWENTLLELQKEYKQ